MGGHALQIAADATGEPRLDSSKWRSWPPVTRHEPQCVTVRCWPRCSCRRTIAALRDWQPASQPSPVEPAMDGRERQQSAIQSRGRGWV